ncbi:NRPS condensation-like uncharacterized protein [Pedobacter sp. AK017]|uniref:phthiocerol/phthiodiolone dimycocerosyl transferase family protein n=1 Tax=Pedobacter sp. AK017 TaxID=2723073 RepID=UPI0016211433|nr:hypothetical protein [Pedobacter sp. AK017]MBB5440460.1 NRPS condensation-like uncharacterized protein [Pedobacter sp. AK017]
MQRRHPNLSVCISGRDYHLTTFEDVKDCRIPLRVINAVLNEDWACIVEDELDKAIDLSIAPLVRAVLVQQAGKTIFIFVANHSISDGMSVALVIRDILSVIAGQTMGNLSPIPSIDGIIGIEPIDNQSKNPTVHSEICEPVNRENTSIAYLRFSMELTKAIVKRSKLEQTTVHGALGAALVAALTNDQMDKTPVRIMHPISARKTLNMGEDFSLLINIVTSAYHTSSSDKFWDIAREVRQSVAVTQNAEWIGSDTRAAQQLFNSNLSLETIQQALAAGTSHEIMLTNLGELAFETIFGPLQLLHLWGPMVLTPHLEARTVGVATFNGELTLTVTGRYESSVLLETVRKILEKVCGSDVDHNIDALIDQPNVGRR